MMSNRRTAVDLLTWAARATSLVDAVTVPDGGFSIDPFTGEDVTGGYAVAAHPECETITGEATLGTILEFCLRNADALTLPGRILGGWRDPSDGRVYLDVSIVVTDRDAALSLARDLDQLAIFDFAAGRSIPTYGEQEA